MAIKQCPRAFHRISSTSLVAGSDPTTHVVASTPTWLAETYRDLLAVSGLEHRPQLVTVFSAHGHVGMFLPRLFQRHLVAIGLADIQALIVKARAAGVIQHVPDWQAPLVDRPLYDDVELRRAFARAILAHELGHAILRANGQAKGGVAEERAADRLAGQLEELLGVEWEIGQIVFDLVGCRERVCTHAAPHVRVADYHEGRAIEIQARAEREVQARRRATLGQFTKG